MIYACLIENNELRNKKRFFIICGNLIEKLI